MYLSNLIDTSSPKIWEAEKAHLAFPAIVPYGIKNINLKEDYVVISTIYHPTFISSTLSHFPYLSKSTERLNQLTTPNKR